MEKYKLIDTIIVQLDAMLDMRGVEKCRCAMDTIGKLSELKKAIQDDDEENRRRVNVLQDELRRATAPEGGDDVEEIDGKTYTIGVAGGH